MALDERDLVSAAESPSQVICDMIVVRFSLLSLRKGNEVAYRVPNRTKLSKKLGALKDFANLPLDVFFEVVGYLDPADLLAISRASKDLRATFLSRSSRFVWIRALNNLEVPKCPPYMAEPRYASLIFDTFCSACHSVRASKVNFTFLVRFCSACEKSNTKVGFSFDHDHIPWTFEEKYLHLVPSNNTRQWKSTLNNKWSDRYLVSEVEHVKTQCLELSNKPAVLKKFMEDRQILATTIQHHGIKVYDWYRRRARAISQKRSEIIHQRMSEMGWKKEYYPIAGWSTDQDVKKWNKLLEQETELTDRAWVNVIKQLTELYEYSKKRAVGRLFKV